MGTVTGLEVFLYKTNTSESLGIGQRDIDGARVRTKRPLHMWSHVRNNRLKKNKIFTRVFAGSVTNIRTDHGSHVVSVSERWRRRMFEVGAWPKDEHHDFTGHYRH